MRKRNAPKQETAAHGEAKVTVKVNPAKETKDESNLEVKVLRELVRSRGGQVEVQKRFLDDAPELSIEDRGDLLILRSK